MRYNIFLARFRCNIFVKDFAAPRQYVCVFVCVYVCMVFVHETITCKSIKTLIQEVVTLKDVIVSIKFGQSIAPLQMTSSAN